MDQTPRRTTSLSTTKTNAWDTSQNKPKPSEGKNNPFEIQPQQKDEPLKVQEAMETICQKMQNVQHDVDKEMNEA